MTKSPSDIPTEAKGQVVINAHLFAAPGQADKLQQYLTAVQKHALSDLEPGCVEYRTTRSFVTEGAVKFAVFETYTGPDALTAHFASAPFQELIAAAGSGLLTGPPQVEYFYEFK